MRREPSSHSRVMLPLIEQIIMVLVFMIAAAVCLRAFVYAATVSRQNGERDRALVYAQELAETLKHAGSQGEDPFLAVNEAMGAPAYERTVRVDYDENWTPWAEEARYQMGADKTGSDVPGLAGADIWVRDLTESREILRFHVSWQTEVSGHE